jgi:hypothetical protein
MPKDFHEYCDNKGRTLVLFLASTGYLSAGYTSLAWSTDNKTKEDKEAFVCSLTNEMRVFRPKDPSKALYH